MLFAAGQYNMENNMKNAVFIHIDQGRDDSDPSAVLSGARSMPYSFTPPASHLNWTCRVNNSG